MNTKNLLRGKTAETVIIMVFIGIGTVGLVALDMRAFGSSGSTCVGPTVTVTRMLNATSTAIPECAVTRVVLNTLGCYEFSNGSELCVRGAPANSVADLYLNGTIIVTEQAGYKLACNPAKGQGPCIEGIP